jgi:hypothetical protein
MHWQIIGTSCRPTCWRQVAKCRANIWRHVVVVASLFFVLCVVGSGRCAIKWTQAQPGYIGDRWKALFNTRMIMTLYQGLYVAIKKKMGRVYLSCACRMSLLPILGPICCVGQHVGNKLPNVGLTFGDITPFWAPTMSCHFGRLPTCRLHICRN